MKRRWWLVIALLGGVVSVRHCGGGGGGGSPRSDVRVVTYNIEHFPKDQRQVDGAFDEISGLGASLVAAEEITDPARFVGAAQQRLGAPWRFVHDAVRGGLVGKQHHLGVLYDGAAWRVLSTATHDDTRFGGYDLPVFEVRLAPVDGRGSVVRVLVVHFRPATAGLAVRERQHAALRPLAVAARASGERVVVLGDFNATEPDDRAELAELARAAGLTWASEPLACTAFWDRDDGCPRSRLDHVLVSEPPTQVEAAGACARDGCARQASCPAYVDEVSDHCPVVVEF